MSKRDCCSGFFLLVFFQLCQWSPCAAIGELVSIGGPVSPGEGGLQCPTWTLPTNQSTECECADTIDAIVFCDPATKQAYMHLAYCMGYYEEQDMTVFGSCVYNNYQVYSGSQMNSSSVLHDTHAYYPLPWNKSDLSKSCNYLNRQGLLCGKCIHGFAPPLLSYDLKCMNCSDVSRVKNWLILCARVMVPTTLLYVLALVFRLSLLSPKLGGFILFAQFVSSPPIVRQIVLLFGSEPDTSFWNKELAYAMISMYSWSNLDFFSLFFPPICDPHFSSTFLVFVVNFISVLYPMFLIVLTYLLVELQDRGYRVVEMLQRPFHKVFFSFRRNCNIRRSLIDVFASFLLVSYVRFLSVSLDIITAVRLDNIKNQRVGTFYWNYDASLEIFRKSALPVVIPSLLIILCVLFLPSLLLCGCSVRFFRLLCTRVCRRGSFFLALQAFMDAFQGCYKDGTKPGTCNCRFVAALNLFMRVGLYLSYSIVLGHHSFLFTISLSLVYTVFIAILRPYKSQYAAQNVIEPLFWMLFCLFQVSIFGILFLQTERRNWLSSINILIFIISITPLIYVTCLMLYWFFKTELVQRAKERLCLLVRKGPAEEITEFGADEARRSFNTYIIGLGNRNYGSNVIQNR